MPLTEAQTPTPTRRYQPHKRNGASSPRKTVILPTAHAAEIAKRAREQRLSESAVIAAMVAGALAPAGAPQGGGEQQAHAA